MQQGTLSRTALAYNGQHFTSLNPERQVVKEHQIRIARAIDLAETLNAENLVYLNWMHLNLSLVQIHSSQELTFCWPQKLLAPEAACAFN
jgi:hypothetical protein